MFLRTAGRINPTDAALRLAERLRPALTDLRAAAESAASETDGPASLRGNLAVTSPMSFGTLYLGPILSRFAERYPQLDLRIDYDDRARDLVREGYDLAIRIGEPRDSALIGRTLCVDRMVACASPDYLDRHGWPEVPADLSSHKVFSYAHLPDSRHWLFGRDGRLEPVNVRGQLTLNNGEAMRDFAIAGLGLAMIPRFIAAPSIVSGKLKQVLPDFETRELPILALWPPVTPMPAKLRARSII